MTIATTSDLLIGQWVDSPRLRAAIDALIDAAKEEVSASFERLRLMRTIDGAEGVWLDYLGARLGIRRPATADPAQDDRLGFSDDPDSADASGVGFDQAPLRGDAANDAVFPLPDEIFRRFIRARAVLVLGDGTCQTYARAVRMVDPSASVQDRRDMSVRVVTDRQDQLELADKTGALPRTAGVRIVYANRGRLGFSDDPDSADASGVGFDQGALTPA